MRINIYSTAQHYITTLHADKFDKVATVYNWAVVDAGIDEDMETFMTIELADVWEPEEECQASEIFLSV